MNDVIDMEGSTPKPQQAVAVQQQATPADIVMYAMKNGGTVAEIREFMQLQREWEADQARKAYVEAMAEFKRNPPTIIKDKAVGYTNKDGSFTGYKHATLGNVTNAIVEGLAAHGFSHSWDVKQAGSTAHVTCKITHRLGHSESVTMEAGKDDSGKKNAIQQVASAVSYLQRYTLLLATGLATHDQDDDGQEYGTVDTALADKWLALVAAAKTDEDVVSVWNAGIGPIEASKDAHAYDEFKKAVGQRRAEFTKAAKGGAK